MWKFLLLCSRFYSQARFLGFLRKAGKKVHFIPKLLALYYCLQDKDTPRFVKLVLMGAIGYVIVPFDVLPDIIPFGGWMDDAAVIAMALHFAGTYIKPEHKKKLRIFFLSLMWIGKYGRCFCSTYHFFTIPWSMGRADFTNSPIHRKMNSCISVQIGA